MEAPADVTTKTRPTVTPTPTRVVEVAVHPANGQPLLQSPIVCGSCLHYDEMSARCAASKGTRITAPSWPACIRYIPASRLGRAIRWLQGSPRHLAVLLCGGIGAFVSCALIVAVR